MANFRFLKFTCLVLLFFATWKSYGQNDSLYFEHLTELNGLSHNSVRSIFQDREGFMWFGTSEDGLNKYDGYTFTIFKADPYNPQHTLRHNGISHIYEDPDGRLWVGTYIGLHLLDKRTGKITAFLVDSTFHTPLGTYLNMCFSFFRDGRGLFWLGAGGGINRFDPITKKFTS